MADQEAHVSFKMRSGGAPIDVIVVTGKVQDTRQIARSETYFSGGGGGIQSDGTTLSPAIPITSTTTHWTTDTIFLKYTGGECSFQLVDNPMPLRAGNRISAIYGSLSGGKSWMVVGLYNHDTGEGRTVWKFRASLMRPATFAIEAVVFGAVLLAFSRDMATGHADGGTVLLLLAVGGFAGLIVSAIYAAISGSLLNDRVQACVEAIARCLRQGKDLKTLAMR